MIALETASTRRAQVGAMGALEFAPGLYLYIGSAARGLAGRVARHRRLDKKIRWHIDYMRQIAAWRWAAKFPARLGECRLAKMAAIAVGGSISHPRFGASDCRCPGHLIFTKSAPEEAFDAVRAMGGALIEDSGGQSAGPVE